MAQATVGNQARIIGYEQAIIANQQKILRNQKRLLAKLGDQDRIIRNFKSSTQFLDAILQHFLLAFKGSLLAAVLLQLGIGFGQILVGL